MEDKGGRLREMEDVKIEFDGSWDSRRGKINISVEGAELNVFWKERNSISVAEGADLLENGRCFHECQEVPD